MPHPRISLTEHLYQSPDDREWIIKHIKRKFKKTFVREIMGLDQKYSDSLADKLLHTIMEWKWYQCEKAGKDIFEDDESIIIPPSLRGYDKSLIRAAIAWREKQQRENSTSFREGRDS